MILIILFLLSLLLLYYSYYYYHLNQLQYKESFMNNQSNNNNNHENKDQLLTDHSIPSLLTDLIAFSPYCNTYILPITNEENLQENTNIIYKNNVHNEINLTMIESYLNKFITTLTISTTDTINNVDLTIVNEIVNKYNYGNIDNNDIKGFRPYYDTTYQLQLTRQLNNYFYNIMNYSILIQMIKQLQKFLIKEYQFYTLLDHINFCANFLQYNQKTYILFFTVLYRQNKNYGFQILWIFEYHSNSNHYEYYYMKCNGIVSEYDIENKIQLNNRFENDNIHEDKIIFSNKNDIIQTIIKRHRYINNNIIQTSAKCYYPMLDRKKFGKVEYNIDKLHCESTYNYLGKGKEKGIWDKPCIIHSECPFYNRDLKIGGCLGNGYCEMPNHVIQLSPRTYRSK